MKSEWERWGGKGRETTLCMEMDWDVMHAGLDCKHESSGGVFCNQFILESNLQMCADNALLWEYKKYFQLQFA